MSYPLLQVENGQFHIRRRNGWLWGKVEETRLLDDCSLTVAPGEFVYIQGERGAGKTTLARAIMQLTPFTAGTVHFNGQSILNLSGRKLRQLRQQMQLLFQNPYTALNPRLTVAEIVAEPLRIHGLASGAAGREAAAGLLARVGVNGYLAGRRPFELSGGQRQRVSLARTLACQPSLLIVDDPASGLDAAVGGQILRLIDKLRIEMGWACLPLAAAPPPDWLAVDRRIFLENGRLTADRRDLRIEPNP